MYSCRFFHISLMVCVLSFLSLLSLVAGFVYPTSLTTTGGQFSGNFSVENLINEACKSPADSLSATANNSEKGYATQNPPVGGYPVVITFNFLTSQDLEAFYLWNNATSSTIASKGIKNFSLTFFDGVGGSGSQVGNIYSGAATQGPVTGDYTAQQFTFATSYEGVRSVQLSITDNHIGSSWVGAREIAFESESTIAAEVIAYGSSGGVVQRPQKVTLNWEVSGEITSLEIQPDIGDVLPLTTAGVGSVEVSPIGHRDYTLVVNGESQQSVEVVGLPEKQKVHLYLLIGQSNMEGKGRALDAELDAPDARVLQYGSRDGMESTWVLAEHGLVDIAGGETKNGMGLEFAKSMLAASADDEVVVGLINHAKGATAIQWWAPGAENTSHNNPQTGQAYYLYDEAIQRVQAASNYGVVKGVLWHQGEYNSNNNSNPSSEPALYAGRLQVLVDNLRHSIGDPSLPFVCGKFVPSSWVNDGGQTITYSGLPNRSVVEQALTDLPNQRSNTMCVDNQGLRGMDDEKIHFDSWSQRQLGIRYAAAIQQMRDDPYKLYMGGLYGPDQLADENLLDKDGDNDRDGFSNYIEYAFGMDPTQVNRGGALSVDDQTSVLQYRRLSSSDAPTYTIEISTDMVNWLRNDEGLENISIEVGSAVDNGDGTETVSVMSALANKNQFYRLVVEESQE